MITIISDDRRQQVGARIREALEKRGAACRYFSADRLHIRPCSGCGSCGGKTFGRCVLRDDMEQVLAAMSRGGVWLLAGPVTFGGYSSQAKKVLDRLCTLGDPYYHVARGELVKGAGGMGSRFYAVGVKEHCADAEREAFLALHGENIRIMNCAGGAFVLGEAPEDSRIEAIAEALCHG